MMLARDPSAHLSRVETAAILPVAASTMCQTARLCMSLLAPPGVRETNCEFAVSEFPEDRPGRLGDPSMELRSDPRADPRLVAALSPLGLDRAVAPPTVTRNSTREELLDWADKYERDFETAFAAALVGAPAIEGINRTTVTITGTDGNAIELYISRPHGINRTLPRILQFHGGGMIILSTTVPLYARLRDAIAQAGAVVIGVEFRNGAGKLGAHPHPAGLNDCTAALRWVYENRDALSIPQ